MVLTTPDANRTMLSYLGTPAALVLDTALAAAISHARLLVIEGYVWEMPDAAASIAAAMKVAHANGTLVAMTAGDAGCVMRNRDELWSALHSGVDILFTNKCAHRLCSLPFAHRRCLLTPHYRLCYQNCIFLS